MFVRVYFLYLFLFLFMLQNKGSENQLIFLFFATKESFFAFSGWCLTSSLACKNHGF